MSKKERKCKVNSKIDTYITQEKNAAIHRGKFQDVISIYILEIVSTLIYSGVYLIIDKIATLGYGTDFFIEFLSIINLLLYFLIICLFFPRMQEKTMYSSKALAAIYQLHQLIIGASFLVIGNILSMESLKTLAIIKFTLWLGFSVSLEELLSGKNIAYILKMMIKSCYNEELNKHQLCWIILLDIIMMISFAIIIKVVTPEVILGFYLVLLFVVLGLIILRRIKGKNEKIFAEHILNKSKELNTIVLASDVNIARLRKSNTMLDKKIKECKKTQMREKRYGIVFIINKNMRQQLDEIENIIESEGKIIDPLVYEFGGQKKRFSRVNILNSAPIEISLEEYRKIIE